MAQQTAIDWYFNKILGSLHISTSKIDIDELLIEAKQMEKEQIQKAFSDGQETPLNHPTLPLYSREEYYKETFGGL